MRTEDFDYSLPKEFIAQDPVVPRDHSRLMVVDTACGLKVSHKRFFDVADFLKPGDVLVVNRSKVIPARIIFSSNGKELEIFLLKFFGDMKYRVMVRNGREFRIGASHVINGDLACEVKEVLDDGTRIVEFFGSDAAIEAAGVTPLPPYITDSSSTAEQYQTVYAKECGSVAAPTAGFHFTDELLARLKSNGVQVEEVILHVGRGTFLPVKTNLITDHEMHSESFELSAKVADRLNLAKREGRRVIAVGTTSVRVLETTFSDGKFVPRVGDTNIFIYPGYKWKAVDALITNFHLPKSTLLMLVSSFLDYKGISAPVKSLLDLYEIAKSEKYRFYSFGDAMFIF